jgi:hypothetical protein
MLHPKAHPRHIDIVTLARFGDGFNHLVESFSERCLSRDDQVAQALQSVPCRGDGR